MKNTVLTFFVLFVIIDCKVSNPQSRNYPTITDRKIVWDNCFSCHEPTQKSRSNIPQVKMVEELGLKGFKIYLNNNFKKGSKNCLVNEHCQIILTNKEIESVYLYIKESKRYAY